MYGGHDQPEPLHHARATSRGGKLLIEEPPLQILPSLAVAIGLNEAIFLQQLHYWVRMSSHVHEGRRWVYNSLAEWQLQFPFWSDRTLRRVIKSLESPLPGYGRALMISTPHLNTHPMDKTKWYTLDYALVNELSAQTHHVAATPSRRRGGQIGHLEDAASPVPYGPSEHLDGPGSLVPSGQSGHLERPYCPAPCGQSGHLDGPCCPAPCGQSGHLSLQRLPETTDKKPTPCARACEKPQSEAAPVLGPSAHPAEGVPPATAVAACTTTPKTAEGFHQQAVALVQHFHQQFHGGKVPTPHRAELAHASDLLRHHGAGFASFFLTYAQQAVRQEGRTVHVFGGLMRYESSALAAYERHAAREATQQAETMAEQQRRRLDAYETWLRHQLEALKEALSPAQLQALRTQAEQRLGAAEKIPPYALACRVAHEVDTQLIRTHGLPSFEVWSKQHER